VTQFIGVLLAFGAGSLPFSVWVGRLAYGRDVREVGDGNPGATNVLRLGSRRWFAVAAFLDGLKAAVPVWVAAVALGWTGLSLAAIATAAVAGHAFSPLLGFRGGKAVAATFGAWAGLTVWEGPTMLGLLLGLAYWRIATSGWAVMVAYIGMLAYLLLTPPDWNLLGIRPDRATVSAAWLGIAFILGWKHRAELSQKPTMRHAGAQPAGSEPQ
jgi:glycerol-3-phosphate acyltransferase PlsY